MAGLRRAQPWWLPTRRLARPATTDLFAALLSTPFDAELVALWVGEHGPSGAIGFPVISDEGGTKPEHALDLLVTCSIGGLQIKMYPVLYRFRLGHRDEEQTWTAVWRDDQGLRITGGVGVIRIFLIAGDLTPEAGETGVVGTVDRDVPDTRGHAAP